jgi:hypothetical protein
MVSEQYLGTAADIGFAAGGREAAITPERTRHLAFGDVAAAGGVRHLHRHRQRQGARSRSAARPGRSEAACGCSGWAWW